MNHLLRFLVIGLFSVGCTLSVAADSGPVARNPPLSPGAGRFDFSHADKTIPVWYYLPADARADTPILIVMHGVGRAATRYRDDWAPYAQQLHFLVVVPEFSAAAFPGSASYAQGGTVDEKGHPLPREQWTFSFIEPLFDAVKAATGNRSERYSLYGHSAGAQFVHRYLYFVAGARVGKAMAANAGWWTLPDPAVKFPYGLRDSVVDTAALKTALQRPLTILLGTADTDPEAENLRKTPEALAQGSNRFTRGHTFFDVGKHRAETLGVPFGWRIALAPGIGHTDGGVAAFAAPLLFDGSTGSGVR